MMRTMTFSHSIPIRFAVLALACLIAGCASPPATITGRLVPPEGQAYAILATTYQISQSTSINGEAGAEIVGADKQVTVSSSAGNGRINAPEGHPDAKGGLHLITLPPGEYRIARVFGSYQESRLGFGLGILGGSGSMGMGIGIGSGTGGGQSSYSVPAKYTFQVKAGEVVYVGNTLIRLDTIPSIAIKDEAVRDFYHMKDVWKVTDFSNIQTRIAIEKP